MFWFSESVQRNSVLRNSGGILRNFSIPPKLNCGIPVNTEFRKVRIPQELFFDGIMDTLFSDLCDKHRKRNTYKK